MYTHPPSPPPPSAGVFGGVKVSWAHWNGVFDDNFDADDDLVCVPKLYVADAGSGDVELTYLGYTQRQSLVPEVRHGTCVVVIVTTAVHPARWTLYLTLIWRRFPSLAFGTSRVYHFCVDGVLNASF